MKLRGGEFSTGITGNFRPELTDLIIRNVTLCQIVKKRAFTALSGRA